METPTIAPAVKIDRVAIEVLHDTDANPNDYLFQDEDYRAEDQARLDEWRRDEWYFIGIRAKAQITVPFNANAALCQTIRSGGLWGIESDSDNAHFEETARDECSDLRDQLETLGVDVSDFDALVDAAIEAANYPYPNA